MSKIYRCIFGPEGSLCVFLAQMTKALKIQKDMQNKTGEKQSRQISSSFLPGPQKSLFVMGVYHATHIAECDLYSIGHRGHKRVKDLHTRRSAIFHCLVVARAAQFLRAIGYCASENGQHLLKKLTEIKKGERI